MKPIERTDPNIDAILSPADVRAWTGLSEATLWRLRKRGDFPEPVRLSPQRIGWRRSALVGWLAARGGQ